MITTRRAAFFPVEDPSGKPNCKRFYRIEKDGSVTERVFLDVADIAEREQLICIHYLRHKVKHFLTEDVGVRVLARDDPWDFRVELSNGQVLNIEITSVADSSQHFEMNKREERLAAYVMLEEISMRGLRWLNRVFTDPQLEALLKEHEARGVESDQMVKNPIQRERSCIFLSSLFNPKESLEEQLRAVIEKKVKKRHQGKERTVLIVDNRTSAYDVPGYVEAAKALAPFLDSVPFPEIWFYTGYYSDHTGNYAEFSFSPLKVSDDQARALNELAAQAGTESGARILW